MLEASDESPEAQEARAKAQALAYAVLESLRDTQTPDALGANALAYALVLIGTHSETTPWRDVARMLRCAADNIELVRAEAAGGLH